MFKLQYIHNNPVKAGLVEKPEDYLLSSARDYNGAKDLLPLPVPVRRALNTLRRLILCGIDMITWANIDAKVGLRRHVPVGDWSSEDILRALR